MTKPTPSAVQGLIRQAGNKAPSAATSKSLYMERMLQKLVEPLDAPPPMTFKEQGDLAGKLRNTMKEDLSQKTEKPIQSHFRGLFAGLDAITSTDQASTNLLHCTDTKRNKVINQCQGEPEVLTILDHLYYHGKLSRPVASAILKHKSVTDIEHINELVNSGGNLIKWSGQDKYVFKLQTANKYWYLKQADKARELVTDCLEATWIPVLIKGELDPNAVRGLSRAIIALGGREKLLQEIGKWSTGQLPDDGSQGIVTKTLIPFWASFMQAEDFELTKKAIDVSHNILDRSNVHSNTFMKVFIECLAVLSEAASESSSLKRYLLGELKVYKLGISPIDTEKHLDTSVLNHVLDVATKMEEAGYHTVTDSVLKEINGSIENLLKVVDSYQTISMALAVQKLKVLNSRASCHTENASAPSFQHKEEVHAVFKNLS